MPVPSSGSSVGGGIQDTDYRGWPFVPGTTEGKGPVKGMQGGDGAWFSGGAHTNATWEGGGGET